MSQFGCCHQTRLHETRSRVLTFRHSHFQSIHPLLPFPLRYMHNQPVIRPLARSQLPRSRPPHSHANRRTSRTNPPSITFSSYVLSDQIDRRHYDPQGLTNALRAAMQTNTVQVSLRMALRRSGGGKVYLVATRYALTFPLRLISFSFLPQGRRFGLRHMLRAALHGQSLQGIDIRQG